jgi:hypothetical protein
LEGHLDPELIQVEFYNKCVKLKVGRSLSHGQFIGSNHPIEEKR